MAFESHLDKVLEKLKLSKRDALEKIGLTCVANTQTIAPVGTDKNDLHKGNLRRSITYQVESGGSAVDIGVTHDADYALWVDQGSSKQKGQRFLENGINNSIDQIKNVTKQSYNEHLGG